MKVKYKANAAQWPTQIAPNLVATVPGVGTIQGVDIDGSPYDVEMTMDMTAEGMRPTSVTVTACAGSPPVTGTTLRSVRVWDLARHVILAAVDRGTIERAGPHSVRVVERGLSLTDADAARLRRDGPTDESLDWVATCYNLALVLGLPPAKQVQVELQLPRTTATKWIKRARDKGLLGAEEAGDGEHQQED